MENGTKTRTQECGCVITSLYGQGDLIDTFVDACEEHDHLLYL